MFGQVLFFCIGAVVMGLILFPVLRSRKKRITALEAANEESVKNTLEFKDRTCELAAAVRESVISIPLFGHDKFVTGKKQSSGIETIVNSINENAHIAAEIADKTSSVAAIASKMEEHVLQGFVTLGKNVKKMEDIREKNSGAINGIVSLSNKVNKIRDIVRTINTITDQTKVIAFNAALEAASAGETGKRFAVVAGEVNRLADDIDILTRLIREQV